MDGVGAVLKAAGLGYEHLVKCHVYLANMDDYAAMNAAYGSYFTDRVPGADDGAGGGAAGRAPASRSRASRYADLARHLGRAAAGRFAAGAARAVLAGRVGRRHAVRLRHGRTGSGDQGGGRRGRGAGHADGRQHHDDAEGGRARRWPTSCGRRRYATRARRGGGARSADARRGGRTVAARPGGVAAAARADPRRADVRRGQAVGGRRDRRCSRCTTCVPSRRRRGRRLYVDAAPGAGDDVDDAGRAAFRRCSRALQQAGFDCATSPR